jgi:hypothetical protein
MSSYETVVGRWFPKSGRKTTTYRTILERWFPRLYKDVSNRAIPAGNIGFTPRELWDLICRIDDLESYRTYNDVLARIEAELL